MSTRGDETAADAVFLPEVGRVDRARALRYLFIWVAILVVLFVQAEATDPAPNAMAVQSLLVFAFGLFCLSRATATGFWSPATLFLLVVAIFHISLAAHMLTGVDPELPRTADYVWYTGAAGAVALELTTIGMAAYTAAVLLRVGVHRDRLRTQRTDDVGLAARFSRLGALVLIVGVLAWFWMAMSSVGLAGITGSYQTFLVGTQASDIHLTSPLIAVGLGLAAMTPPGALQKTAFVLFAVFGVFGFFLGLRGEMLFPLAVAVIAIPLYNHIRNSSVPVLPSIAVGVILVLLVYATRRFSLGRARVVARA